MNVSYKYVGLWLDNKLNWASNADHLQSIYRPSTSESPQQTVLLEETAIIQHMQEAPVDVIFYDVVWGGGAYLKVGPADQTRPDSLVAERRTSTNCWLLWTTLVSAHCRQQQRSWFSGDITKVYNA